jgi:adenylate cyclase
LAGDGVLTEFPTADAAIGWAGAVQQGVRLGLQSQHAFDPPPIVLRIGVHVGTVIAIGDRILGHAVNFTARLQAHAAPGGIVASEAAHETLEQDARAGLRDMGLVVLKGFERRAHIFASDADPVPMTMPLQAVGGLPSIAVLPILEQGAHPDESFRAEGLVEDIAISLAGLHELFVVSTASSAMYRGHLPDPREAGRAPGVSYVLLGRMRRAPRGLRISTQLSAARSGAALWGDRMQVAAADIFKRHEEIVRKVVAGLAPQVRGMELQWAMRKRPLRWIRRSAAENPLHGPLLQVLAAMLAALGRRKDARHVMVRLLKLK